QETGSWQSRKDRIRQKFYEKIIPIGTTDPPSPLDDATTPPPSGDVPSAPATGADSSATADVPPSGFSATSASATEASATPPSPPLPSTPAASTSSSSVVSTAWTVPPTGFIENNLKQTIVEANGSLVPGLSPNAQSLLRKLATGNGQSEAHMARQVTELFVQEEGEPAERQSNTAGE